MQLGTGVNWTLLDFMVMGCLLMFTGCGYVLVSYGFARSNPKKRLAIGAAFLLFFLYAWAELAVGIFFNLGS